MSGGAISPAHPGGELRFGWLDSVHPDDREKAGSAFRPANARTRPSARSTGSGGTTAPTGGSSTRPPLGSPDSAYLGYIGSVLDVTDEKRAEEEIRRARDELDVRVRERTAELTEAMAALGRQEEVRKGCSVRS